MGDTDRVRVTRCNECPWEHDGECLHIGTAHLVIREPTDPPPDWCPLRTRPMLVEVE